MPDCWDVGRVGEDAADNQQLKTEAHIGQLIERKFSKLQKLAGQLPIPLCGARAACLQLLNVLYLPKSAWMQADDLATNRQRRTRHERDYPRYAHPHVHAQKVSCTVEVQTTTSTAV